MGNHWNILIGGIKIFNLCLRHSPLAVMGKIYGVERRKDRVLERAVRKSLQVPRLGNSDSEGTGKQKGLIYSGIKSG